MSCFLFKFYEKSLIYNGLIFYEENFYKSSVLKIQDKIKSSKPDEKMRDHLLQIVERDNQITLDIINQIRRDFISKLEPYLTQYQVIKKY